MSFCSTLSKDYWYLVFTTTRTRLKENCLCKCNKATYLTAKGREEPVFASDWMVWRLRGNVFADSDGDYESGGFDYHKSIYMCLTDGRFSFNNEWALIKKPAWQVERSQESSKMFSFAHLAAWMRIDVNIGYISILTWICTKNAEK